MKLLINNALTSLPLWLAHYRHEFWSQALRHQVLTDLPCCLGLVKSIAQNQSDWTHVTTISGVSYPVGTSVIYFVADTYPSNCSFSKRSALTLASLSSSDFSFDANQLDTKLLLLRGGVPAKGSLVGAAGVSTGDFLPLSSSSSFAGEGAAWLST